MNNYSVSISYLCRVGRIRSAQFPIKSLNKNKAILLAQTDLFDREPLAEIKKIKVIKIN